LCSPREDFGRMGVGPRSKAWRFIDNHTVRSLPPVRLVIFICNAGGPLSSGSAQHNPRDLSSRFRPKSAIRRCTILSVLCHVPFHVPCSSLPESATWKQCPSSTLAGYLIPARLDGRLPVPVGSRTSALRVSPPWIYPRASLGYLVTA